MKQIIILLLILLTACQQAYDFTSVEKQISMLSQKYRTDWKQEAINQQMSQLETIDAQIQEILELKQAVENSNSADKNASITFLQARVTMLKSQKHFQQAHKLDPRPLAEMRIVGTKEIMNADVLKGFSCDNREKITQATALYQLSLSEAHDAFNELDEVMQKYEFTREIIGMKTPAEDKRPEFYKAELGRVWLTIRLNNLLLNYCKDNKVFKPSEVTLPNEAQDN